LILPGSRRKLAIPDHAPALNKARDVAKISVRGANVKSVMLSMLIYPEEYKGQVPFAWLGTNPPSGIWSVMTY